MVVDESHCIKKWGMDGPGKRHLAFRKSYQEIGNIRSMLGQRVPCLSLTATATKETKKAIVQTLGMNNCENIVIDANKPNIRYSVVKVDCDHRKNFTWLANELQTNGRDTVRHIVFCHRAQDMHMLFTFFDKRLEAKQYVPNDSGIISEDYRGRVFAMYHQKTHNDIQEHIRSSFSKECGLVRVLFCTIAFGMGVNVKGVSNVIHYGPSSDLDDYLQESGRGGRNPDIQSHAVLLDYKGSTRGNNISKTMRNYVKDINICKRILLLKELQDNPESNSVMHTCCNICAASCKCSCVCNQAKCECLSPCSSKYNILSLAEKKLHHLYFESSSSESENECALFEEIETRMSTRNALCSDSEIDALDDTFRRPMLGSSDDSEN